MNNFVVRTKNQFVQKNSSLDFYSVYSGADSGPAAPSDTHFGPTEQPEEWGGGNSANRKGFKAVFWALWVKIPPKLSFS